MVVDSTCPLMIAMMSNPLLQYAVIYVCIEFRSFVKISLASLALLFLLIVERNVESGAGLSSDCLRQQGFSCR